MEPRIRVAGILKKDDSLLLIRHKKEGKSYWLLPGGGVDYGETVEESLEREFLEECNIEVEVDKMVFVSQGIAPDKSKHILQLVFLVNYKKGDLKVGDEERLRETKYIPLKDLETITLYPNIKEEIKSYYNGEDIEKYLGHRWE